MAYTKYSLTPANNTAAPPDGAPEGMLPSAVNDTMRDMMAQIRDCGDGIRDGTYTMTAPKITGGTITGAAFTGNTFTSPVISGGTINNATIGATTATTGKFTTLEATGVATFSAGTVSAPAITTTGDTNTGMFFPAADTIAFTEGGVESMRIDSSGQVGVGVTPSAWGASWKSLSVNTVGALAATTGVTRLFHNAFNNDSANVYRTTAAASMYSQDAGTHQWFYAASGTAGTNISFTEAMRIDSSGNVGIGTSSPSAPLDIQSNSGGTGIRVRGRASANAGAIRYFANDNTTQRARIESNDTSLEINSISSLPITILTADTERMRIDSSGNVGIGCTPSAWYTGYTASQVGVNGSVWANRTTSDTNIVGIGSNQFLNAAATNRIYISNGFASRYEQSSGVHAWHTAASGTAGNAISFSESMRITSGGNLIVGTTATINSERLNVRQSSSANTTGIAVGYGTSAGEFRSMSIISTNVMTFNNGSNEASLSAAGAWTNASDARLKNSIVDIKYGLQTVLATQPRSYKMNDLEGDYIGFVAQELQNVIPEVVSGDPETQLGVDYGSLVAVAFKAIQEQQALIENLTTRLNALEGN